MDTYDAQGVLDGASQFEAGYVMATGRFAYAQYKFPAFMDTRFVGRVIDMVAVKYGQPSSRNGRDDLGPVTAKWKFGQGMRIEVSRGWPDTTTFLGFADPSAARQALTEIETQEKAQTTQRAKSQSKAF